MSAGAQTEGGALSPASYFLFVGSARMLMSVFGLINRLGDGGALVFGRTRRTGRMKRLS